MPDLFDNRYRFKNDLGVGGYGRVFLAMKTRCPEKTITSLSKRENLKKTKPIHGKTSSIFKCFRQN